jgi:hypothetical protein
MQELSDLFRMRAREEERQFFFFFLYSSLFWGFSLSVQPFWPKRSESSCILVHPLKTTQYRMASHNLPLGPIVRKSLSAPRDALFLERRW